MAKVYVSIGSNIERQKYITNSLDALADRFGALVISPVYESESVGFDGDNFFNLVVGLETSLSIAELSSCFRAIEDVNQRDRSGPKFGGRTLDLDILTYDDVIGVIDGVTVPRGEILTNAFVLLPLADIAADAQHPEKKMTYRQLWQQYSTGQKLWTVDFEWRGQSISAA
ncbi:2-amino-4-hydroxy-6-hydroxymethyldihydropteridinepyrophosphokinase [Sinobacterium norvegicum]|uniref:2-amino-4-hydroxy-6-hydroxymethyldihydropteridine diphosphokinase n=1 Tax=Sinobacterium norvegicum TaxID=1641715 RepID=A0ABM9AGF3_9GAMM|nr:2-amino-4-hydroxy-6-hydroxymethyldihydropteridine diphosphokinase [Sinobacterium norvegicum]CAH0992111.1 2-amino-4-hydroxy-6-hydroxymethyldihydropteridinepyrophosphokinase [Sinobacterium norvegicum]